ncbi:39kDa subunit of ndufa9, NADH:ubiquinone oxidoreductase [Blyttiomyces sp. JEL0837]|nr:39kDa subunit of ndufa9, NADH:ubiquinone oxidoreductase [Blyttiomyces sp. JEL0837]
MSRILKASPPHRDRVFKIEHQERMWHASIASILSVKFLWHINQIRFISRNGIRLRIQIALLEEIGRKPGGRNEIFLHHNSVLTLSLLISQYKWHTQRSLHDVAKRQSSGEIFVRAGPGGRSSVSGHVATVFGATGFLGGYVVNALGRRGTQVITPYRGTDDDRRHLRVMGDLGQIVQLRFDLRNEEALVACTKHSDTVINLMGRDYGTKNFSLNAVHVDGARKVAKLARELGVSKFVHVSALGAHVDSPSKFMKAKALGEIAVREEFPDATIIRPSTIYGSEDKFWNRLGWHTKLSPYGVPIPNGGNTILRPVYVGDVSAAIAATLRDDRAVGKIVELYGPHAYRYEDIVQYFLQVTHQNPTVWHSPKFVYKLIATAMNSSMFNPIITPDEAERPQDKDALTFADFGIKPETIEDTILKFVRMFRPPEYQRAPYEKDMKRAKLEHLEA